MNEWKPKSIYISRNNKHYEGYALSYYYKKEGEHERLPLAEEIVKIKQKVWQFSKSGKIIGYLNKFFRLNPKLFVDIDLITYVPSNIYSNNRMGNLAKYIADKLNKPLYNLITCSSTSSNYHTQKEFTKEYQEKLKKFDIKDEASRISKKNVLLIDDICTTGATLFVCASKLDEFSPANITLFTLCTSRNQYNGFDNEEKENQNDSFEEDLPF
ncbi:TPA: hypothetical protein GX533_00510 [Candidatus Dojkabacteria bacterium]|jgi:predicted amidophosphoribosyltransferase|uniref:Phosphoribosyltransferase domain-containing protein n=1 Tax=Candidatus Dojkabacteria bacterium TaxID=2099670 RepID=A0A832QES8_9BACT|nr:hypothetical protein [Candidatus Dojkabacteria bacterium]